MKALSNYTVSNHSLYRQWKYIVHLPEFLSTLAFFMISTDVIYSFFLRNTTNLFLTYMKTNMVSYKASLKILLPRNMSSTLWNWILVWSQRIQNLFLNNLWMAYYIKEIKVLLLLPRILPCNLEVVYLTWTTDILKCLLCFPQRLEEMIKFTWTSKNAENIDVKKKLWESTSMFHSFLFLNKK